MILWLIYIVIDALVNWYWIEKKKSVPNYTLLTIVRGWFFIMIGITVPITEAMLFDWFIFTTGSFWILFDMLLNILRGKNLFYLGENSKIDNLGKLYPYIYWTLKALVLIYIIHEQF